MCGKKIDNKKMLEYYKIPLRYHIMKILQKQGQEEGSEGNIFVLINLNGKRKEEHNMKKIVVCCLTVSFILGFSISKVLAQPMELKGVGFLPKNHRLCAMIPVWIDKINAEVKEIKINWVGGPEVMPAFDQPEAVRKGMFQVGFLPAAYYGGLLPEGDAISLSKYDFKKEREKGGVWDYFMERHKKINMMILGTWLYDPFYLYVKKSASGVEDLKGLKMRTAAKYDKMMAKLGMVPVTVQFGETYTALQRGVVDGFGWPTIGPREWGWLEFSKHVIDIPFYTRQNTFMVMNLDAWSKLPKSAQDKIVDITIKYEPEMKAYFDKEIQKEKQEMEKLGVKRIKFSAADTKKYIDTANDAHWEDLEKKVPEEVKVMKKLMGY
jgi:TRAP-type C4-dicarboxylate transport system substrate-binding protein